MIKQRCRAMLIAVIVVAVGPSAWGQGGPGAGDVLFICKHGNVKSLMAASYFNRIATERGLPFRASARGSVVDTPEVPVTIATKLEAEGFEVSAFRAEPASAGDIAAADHIVLIETSLPTAETKTAAKILRWDDVPPASVDYAAARTALKSHIEKLVDQLAESQVQ